ncbi:MAG: hypothetical protein B6U76_01025 [Desulfurococcales archaeon ex4484_217_2]|nr:MAG: hypothetical protein B6U76_01025 [Desulfurococcales archaeon ex4484_217_2]
MIEYVPAILGFAGAAALAYFWFAKPNKPSEPATNIKASDTGDNVRIVLNVPREIIINIDPQDLLNYIVVNKFMREAEKEEKTSAKEEKEEEEKTLPTDVLIGKGLVKEG